MLVTNPLERLVIPFVILLEILVHGKQVVGVKSSAIQHPGGQGSGHTTVPIQERVQVYRVLRPLVRKRIVDKSTTRPVVYRLVSKL